jgi:hypothetical protein
MGKGINALKKMNNWARVLLFISHFTLLTSPFTLLISPFTLPAFGGEPIMVGSFGQDGLEGWETKEFKGLTEYTAVDEGGRRVLKAVSRGTASGLIRKISVDPEEYPIISWSWKVEDVVKGGDETKKSGDDYAARVYLVFNAPIFFQATTVNYIWANRLPRGQSTPNPFLPKNAMMLAVESGRDRVGQWIDEERNIIEDYRKLFGKKPPRIAAVAIMTDTDNTNGSAVAYYGDIVLKGPKP